MLSGRPPHSGSSPAALLREDTDGPPVMDGIDATLAAVVGACLQPRPEDRPRHAGEVGTALRAWLARDASGAIAHITKHQDEILTQAQMTPSTPAARSVRRPRVGRRVAAIAGALVAAAAVLAAVRKARELVDVLDRDEAS